MFRKNAFFSIHSNPDIYGGGSYMSKRINEKFLDCYMETDKLCAVKFGIAMGGVTEYINRLNNTRFAPGRDDILQHLVRFRSIRNRLAHEAGAIRRLDEISKHDIKWLKEFNKELIKKRDPISQYLRHARSYIRHKKLKMALIGVAIAVIAVIGVLVYFAINKG